MPSLIAFAVLFAVIHFLGVSRGEVILQSLGAFGCGMMVGAVIAMAGLRSAQRHTLKIDPLHVISSSNRSPNTTTIRITQEIPDEDRASQ